MLRIVIPTHNRVGRQTTLSTLPSALRAATLLVASTESEAELLRKQHKHVKVAPVSSIAEKRQWIIENIKGRLIMLDDDMQPFARSPVAQREYRDGRWKPKQGYNQGMAKHFVTGTSLEEVFGYLEAQLKTHAHVGISSRLGNDMEALERKVGPQRMMHAIGYDTAVLRKAKIRFDEVKIREDFHVTLALLKRGLPSAVVFDHCYSPGPYGSEGGCSAERTVALSDAQAEVLAALHQPFVRVVEKLYKETPRKEVVVCWKKCYDSSKT
jgi:hypothetical protein